MYGGGNEAADKEEFLRQQQQHQNSQYNFNYYPGEASNPAAPAVAAPEYPTASSGVTSQFNQYGQSASSTASAPAPFGQSASGAFDNVDISRNNQKFSGGTPFETVHEYVSVSNKVRKSEVYLSA